MHIIVMTAHQSIQHVNVSL